MSPQKQQREMRGGGGRGQTTEGRESYGKVVMKWDCDWLMYMSMVTIESGSTADSVITLMRTHHFNMSGSNRRRSLSS